MCADGGVCRTISGWLIFVIAVDFFIGNKSHYIVYILAAIPNEIMHGSSNGAMLNEWDLLLEMISTNKSDVWGAAHYTTVR